MRLRSLPNRVEVANVGLRYEPYERLRGSSTSRGYGYKWRKARERYFRRSPLCVECAKHGWVTEATDLDHIIPHKGNMTLFWDESNWQGLCHSHHSEKTSREDGGFANPTGGG